MKALAASLAAPLALLSAPVAAEPLIRFDYGVMFEALADEVIEGPTGAPMLVLGGGVSIPVQGEGPEATCCALDTSPHGAGGCLGYLLMGTAAFARTCPGAMPDGPAANLASYRDRVLESHARDTQSPRSIDEARARFDEGVAQYATRFRAEGRCEIPPDALNIYTAMAGDDLGASLDAALSVPRLPVANPCL